MATNLHALIRYRTIDKCIRDVDRLWRWQQLAEACSHELKSQMGIDKNISRRTIFMDIQNMKSGKLGYHAPIENDRKEGYYYSDSKFSINNVPLKKEDMDELNNALLILKQFSGKESIAGLENVLVKLEDTLQIKRGRKKSQEIIQFEHSLNEPGQKWLNGIYDAIKNKQAITISYQPFDREPRPVVMSPYLLKENNNRWFCFGHSHEYGNLTNIGLDRIVDFKKSLQPYLENESYDLGEYFESIVGVTRPNDIVRQKITFKAYGRQRRYIETKPIHESQKVVELTDEFGVFEIEVVPNYELEARLLSYGDTVEVLSPSTFREKVFERISLSKKRYDAPN